MDGASPRVLPVPLVGIVLGLLLAAGAATFLTAKAAHAEVLGPCTATIAGVDIGPLDSERTGDAISVAKNAEIITTMSAQQGFQEHKIKLRFLGNVFPARTVEHRTDNGELSFTETVEVSDYTWAGVGFYKVFGTATLADGTRCSGAALVKVTGRNPLTTVAGGVATGAVVVGTVAAGASAVSAAAGRGRVLSPIQDMVEDAFRETDARRREEEWQRFEQSRPRETSMPWEAFGMVGCLCFAAVAIIMTPLLAVTGGAPGGVPPRAPVAAPAAERPPRRLPRARWLPRITLVGLVGGLFAGAGVLVLLQQFAVIYPTMSWAICLLVIGAIAYGFVLPTLGFTIGWLRVNSKVARLEHELGW